MPKNKVRFSPTRLMIGISLCLGSVASFPMPAAAACQAGQAGCVLPVGETPPPVVRETQPPPVIDGPRGGFSWLAILAALAALAALLLLVLNEDDEERPVSP